MVQENVVIKSSTSLIFSLLVGGLLFISRSAVEFLDPQYWNPASLMDYLAVILTTLQDFFLGLSLFLMYQVGPKDVDVTTGMWRISILLTAFGSFISGLGNLLEDALGFSKIGGMLFSFGGMGSGIALIVTFASAFAISDIRIRWSWFYLVPLVAVVVFSNFGGFLVGASMIALARFEMKNL